MGGIQLDDGFLKLVRSLSKNEAWVYLRLVELGRTSVEGDYFSYRVIGAGSLSPRAVKEAMGGLLARGLIERVEKIDYPVYLVKSPPDGSVGV